MDTISEGFLLINKPAGITSFTCVYRFKKILGKFIKIGHAGTLDPFATGLLIIAIGKSATKRMESFLTLDKVYTARAKLGHLTDTLDSTGTTLQESATNPETTQQRLLAGIHKLGSSYIQTPPIYSALKHRGKPLYKLVKDNLLAVPQVMEIAEQKKRMVHVYDIKLEEFTNPYFTIKAHVSHGTYIRCLMNDIATMIGSTATTYELERTAIGKFSIQNAHNLEAFTYKQDIERHIISVEKLIASF